MKPVFTLGSLEISSYAVMLCLGGCVSFWLTLREIRRKQLDIRAMVTLTAIMLAAGLFGARATSWVLLRGVPSSDSISSLFSIWDPGGMWLFGGFTMAALAGIAWTRFSGLSPWDAADTLAVSWLPFISLIRVGCFMNGCCYGRPTTAPLGLVAGGATNNVNFGIPSHPTQIYAVAATLAIFGFLWWKRLRRRFTGELAALFLVLYPAFRFLHEFLRGDPRPAWRFGQLGVLTINQIASTLLVATGLLTWVILSGGVARARRR